MADALFGVDNTFLTRALDDGLFEPYTAKGLDGGARRSSSSTRSTASRRSTAATCASTTTSRGSATTVIRPRRRRSPISTKPAYKKLLVVENPATSSPGLAFLLTTIAKFGDDGWQDYWKSLRSNGVRVVDGWDAGLRHRLHRGGRER